MRSLFLTAAALALTACKPPAPPAADERQADAPAPTTTQTPVMAWPALLDRPRPTPTRTYSYGTDPLQVADLWLPPISPATTTPARRT